MVFKVGEILSSLGNSTSAFDEGTGEFLPIDVETAKRNLKLAERARENGENSLPPADSLTKDAIAVEIDTYIKHLILLAKDKFEDRLRTIDDINKVNLISLESIKEIYENTLKELKTTARHRYNELFAAKRDWLLGENEFSRFRDENRRFGPARFPAGKDKIAGYGWLFLAIVVEVIYNAWALGSSHPEGPIGVGIEISTFTTLNVLASFLLGFYIWRYFFHVSLVKKAYATLVAPLLIIFIVCLNLTLAHYRDAVSKLVNSDLSALQMMTSIGQLFRQATDTLIQHPFLLDEFKSVGLLFLGFGASIVVIIKSFGFDDPYPGYGKLSRQQAKLAENFNRQQTAAFDEMNHLVKEKSNDINHDLSTLKASRLRVNLRESDKQTMLNKYNNWLMATKSVGTVLYAFYRDENMKARTDNTEPLCFSSTSFELSDDVNVRIDPARRVALNIGEIEKSCKEYLDDLNSKLTKFQSMFKDIENMSPDQVLGSEYTEPTIFKN